MTPKKLFRLALGLAFAGVFVWLIVRQLHPDQIRKVFSEADSSWIVAALAAFGAGYAARIQRWCVMLKLENPELGWRRCAGPLLGSFAANNVLPFRAGDVLRAFAFSTRLGTSSGAVVATLFAERLLDLLMVLALLGTALALFGLDASGFAGVGSVVMILGAAAILLVLLFPQGFAPLARVVGRTVTRFAPRLGQKLEAGISNSLHTLHYLSKGTTMAQLLAWSIVAWIAEGCVFYFAALALPSIAAPLAGWLALPVGTLATLIPSTPGYVGTFDYFAVKAMTDLGNGVAAATAYALLVHALLWFPPTLGGGLYLLLHPVGQREKLKAVPE